VLLSLLIACAHKPQTAEAEHPLLLWHVERGGKSSYLLGTCHLGVDLDYALPAPHDAALTQARVVFTEAELDLGNPMRLFALILSDGPALSTQLPPDDWRAVATRARDLLPAPLLDHLHPWVVSMALQLPAAGLGGGSGDKAVGSMDKEIQRRAAARGIRRAYVETVEQQAAMLTAQDDLFLKTLRVTAPSPGTKPRDGGSALSDLCYRGDTSNLAALLDPDDPLTAPLLTDRNRAWVPRLVPELAQGGAFVAVGAAHMLGDDGLVALLRKEGFSVHQLSTTRPVVVGPLGGTGEVAITTPPPAPPQLETFIGEFAPKLADGLCADGQVVPTCFEPDHDRCRSRITTDVGLCARQHADLFPADGAAPPQAAIKTIAACAPVGAILDAVAHDRVGTAPMCVAIQSAMEGAMGKAKGG
jgi:hypothetical protein